LLSESEHGHSHGHGTGIPWLDMIVGISAIFISVVSLVVSIGHGRTMERMVEQNERMVAANTMPFLTEVGSNLDPVTEKPAIKIALKNGGVGPAVIDWFQIRYKGVAYSNIDALLRACCEAALPKDGSSPKGVIYSNVSQSILPARESIDPIVLNTEAGKELYIALNKARDDMSYRACYCSVLDECWETDFGAGRPRRVKECHAPDGAALW